MADNRAPAARICFAIVDDHYGFYRTFLPASELAKRGFRVSILKNPDYETLLSFDAVIFEQPYSPTHEELIQRLKGKVRLVLDLDDNYHATDATHPNYEGTVARRPVIERLLKSVDEAIAPTEPIRDFYSQFSPNITCLPNMIVPELFPDQGERPSGPVRIGWQGGFSHLPDFQILKEVLPRVHEEFPDARFVFLGNVPRIEIPNAEIHGPVRFDALPAAVARLRLDIALAPLQDTSFNRSKSNLKWLEYSALGIPTVMSDVAPYSRSVEHGVDGFLAKTTDDWVRELGGLIRDPDLRRAVGARARASAVARFGRGPIGDRYAELAARWPAKASGETAGPAAPWGFDLFLVAMSGTIAVLAPPLTALSGLRPAPSSPGGCILGSVIVSQLISIALVYSAVGACLEIHRVDGALRPVPPSPDAERGLAAFFNHYRFRAISREASRKAIVPALIVAIAGLLPLAIIRRQSSPWNLLTFLYAGVAEMGIAALVFASAYYLTSRRLAATGIQPLDKFLPK